MRPCPMCNCIYVFITYYDLRGFQMECEQCRMCGPCAPNREGALSEWDRLCRKVSVHETVRECRKRSIFELFRL